MEADPSHVLGEGMLEAYLLGVGLDRLGLEEEADPPFAPEVVLKTNERPTAE